MTNSAEVATSGGDLGHGDNLAGDGEERVGLLETILNDAVAGDVVREADGETFSQLVYTRARKCIQLVDGSSDGRGGGSQALYDHVLHGVVGAVELPHLTVDLASRGHRIADDGPHHLLGVADQGKDEGPLDDLEVGRVADGTAVAGEALNLDRWHLVSCTEWKSTS